MAGNTDFQSSDIQCEEVYNESLMLELEKMYEYLSNEEFDKPKLFKKKKRINGKTRVKKFKGSKDKTRFKKRICSS